MLMYYSLVGLMGVSGICLLMALVNSKDDIMI
jgi:hypothetical protein